MHFKIADNDRFGTIQIRESYIPDSGKGDIFVPFISVYAD